LAGSGVMRGSSALGMAMLIGKPPGPGSEPWALLIASGLILENHC
jgi:hypothetical protein